MLNCVRGLQRASKSCEKEHGLSGAQIFVLRILTEGPPRSINVLAAATFTHQSPVSVVVGKLEEAGHVSRRASENNARRTGVELTAPGRDVDALGPTPAREHTPRARCLPLLCGSFVAHGAARVLQSAPF